MFRRQVTYLSKTLGVMINILIFSFLFQTGIGFAAYNLARRMLFDTIVSL